MVRADHDAGADIIHATVPHVAGGFMDAGFGAPWVARGTSGGNNTDCMDKGREFRGK
jgi:hypothetical protein